MFLLDDHACAAGNIKKRLTFNQDGQLAFYRFIFI